MVKGKEGGEGGGCTARRATVPPLLALDLSLLWALPHSSSSRRIAAMALQPIEKAPTRHRGPRNSSRPSSPTQNTTCLRRRRHTSALTRPSLAPHSLAIRISISAISARLRGQHTQAQRRPATPRGLTSHLNLVAAPDQAPLCVAGWLRCGTARWCTSWAGSCERRLFTPPAVNRRGGVRVPRQRHLRRLRL